MKYIFIIFMSICFTNTFQGAMVDFYLKYILAAVLILFFILVLFKNRKTYKKSIDFAKMFCLPYLFIFIWSLLCLFINGHFQKTYLSRLLGQTLYLLINYIVVVAGIHFFEKKTIDYSLYAMLISVIVNLFFTINNYGLNNFLLYLQGLFTNVTFVRGTPLFTISAFLEVQDITMAAGFYLIYYIFYCDEEKKSKKKMIIISLICFILGFKRTGLVAILLTFFIYFFLLKKKKRIGDKINFIFFGYVIAAFTYLIFIKYNILDLITNNFGINAMGRIQIYQKLSKYFNLTPWFIGHGYSYVDKAMYESTTFVSHTVVGKMYAELGFIPFVMWITHFIRNNSRKILLKYGESNCSLYLLCCLYCFTSFFFENTLTLFCFQYSFMLIPLIYNKKKVDD